MNTALTSIPGRGRIVIRPQLGKVNNNMSLRGIALVFLLALALPQLAGAQTQPSLRIRSLGTAFGGILDDYLTDVYLNPARVAQLDRPMAYAATYPSIRFQTAYPVATIYYYDWYFSELSYVEYDTEPVGLGYFGSIGNSLAFSVGVEVGFKSSERFDERSDSDTYGNEIRLRSDGDGWLMDTQHYLLDLSLAPTGGGRSIGARLSAAYDANESGRIYSEHVTEWDVTFPDRVYRRLYLDYFQNEYKRVSVNLALGMFSPDGLLRDVVVKGRMSEHTLDAVSRDSRLYTRSFSFEEFSYEVDSNSYLSSREYSEYGVGARVQFGWSERVRSTHELAWAHTTGDGGGEYNIDDEQYDATTYLSNFHVAYGYDGNTDTYAFESTIGYFNDLFDDVTFAFALYGAYSRTELDEIADGEATLLFYDNGIGLDTTFVSPYQQNHGRELENMRLSLPMAVEWEFHKYAKLRIGVALTASRVEDDRVSDQGAVELTEGFEDLSSTFNFRDMNAQSGVDALFANGLEININDRFIVDLLGQWGTSINVANYGYASVRYKF